MTIQQLNEYAMLGYRVLGIFGWTLACFCMMKYLKN